MEEKNYDYSNKKSYNGVAPKENEALVPFLAHEVLKNYHQDIRDGIRKRNEGIIEDSFETWNIRGRKILVGFTAIPKDQVESYMEGFWKEKDAYLESTRKKRCLILNSKGEYIRCPKYNKSSSAIATTMHAPIITYSIYRNTSYRLFIKGFAIFANYRIL